MPEPPRPTYHTSSTERPATDATLSSIPNPPPVLREMLDTLPTGPLHDLCIAQYRRDMAERDAALARVDGIERLWGMWPTTAEYRRRGKSGT